MTNWSISCPSDLEKNEFSWKKERQWNLRNLLNPPASSQLLPLAPTRFPQNWPSENQVDRFNRPFCGAR
eukprot:3692050-Pyramimonas_sp.AAC.1